MLDEENPSRQTPSEGKNRPQGSQELQYGEIEARGFSCRGFHPCVAYPSSQHSVFVRRDQPARAIPLPQPWRATTVGNWEPEAAIALQPLSAFTGRSILHIRPHATRVLAHKQMVPLGSGPREQARRSPTAGRLVGSLSTCRHRCCRPTRRRPPFPNRPYRPAQPPPNWHPRPRPPRGFARSAV